MGALNKNKLAQDAKSTLGKKRRGDKDFKVCSEKVKHFFLCHAAQQIFFLVLSQFSQKNRQMMFFLLLKFRQNQQTSKVNWAEAVAQLARRLLPAHEDSSSNPNIGKNLCVNCLL